jgi:4-hydroxy-tetrahydrodipicolinate reductase
MEKTVRAVVLGTGKMGSGVIKLLLQKKGLELAGVFGSRKERAGLDVGEVLGLKEKLGLPLSADLEDLLQTAGPDVVVQCTSSTMQQASSQIEAAIKAGAHVVSIAEEASFPFYGSPDTAAHLDTLAQEHNVTVLGTGINPGFVLDLLIIALTGVCFRVDRIKGTRINDLSPYGYNVLKTQGVNLLPEDFMKGVADGSVVGHFGFPESIGMIAKALGWKIARIEQKRVPIVSKVERDGGEIGIIKPGYTAGCTHSGIGYAEDGKALIELVHPQQVHPEDEDQKTGDTIEIFGEPDIRISTGPEIPGGIGTIALAVNMIPKVLNADPGFKTMADLPVPSALMGDVRAMLRSGPSK